MNTESNKRRASQELMVSTSAAETTRLSKRSALAPTEGSVPSLSAEFSGQGIQNCGSGNFSVGRDLVIGGENDNERWQNNRCLRDLRVTDPRHDKRRIESTRDGLLVDVYRWILENDEFRKWHDDEQNRLFWIKGDPGKGKTMLLCGIIDELRKAPISTVSHPENAIDTGLGNWTDTNPAQTTRGIRGTVSFFFCQATDERINTATSVLRGLIYLLLEEQPTLISHLRKQYDCAGKKLFDEGANAWFALSEIFNNMLRDPNLKNTYLIVDALDECRTGLSELLGFILEASATASSPVKWIVSSRNWLSIEKGFDAATQKVKLCLELNEKSVSAAVAQYIKFKVGYLAERNDYDISARETIQKYLLSKAQDTFLWVALVCEILRDLSHQDALEVVNLYPPGLDAVYRRMMDTIYSLHPTHAKTCKSVLAVISVVRRPIVLEELSFFVKLPNGASNDDRYLKKTIKLCGSFLRLQGRTILFVHQSVKDYLLGPARVEAFPDWRVESQQKLMERSIEAMNGTLRRDIYGLRHPGYSIDKIKTPEPDPLASARYACIYWVDHLCETEGGFSKADLYDNGPIDNFLRRHFLHWLEALSLIGGLSDGISAIIKLVDLLTENSPESNLLCLVRDAHRFVLNSRNAIENTPLQTYASALLFSPTRSLIRELFQNEEPDWVIRKPVMEANWGDCIQIFEDDSGFRDVAFSHNDTRVVSRSDGTKTLKVWNSSNGACLETIYNYNYLLKPTISSNYDDQQVVLKLDGNIFEIYDRTSNTSLKFRGHEHSVYSVAFSRDNTQIASLGADGAIKIWNADSCVCIKTFKGMKPHWWLTKHASAMAFSSDGTRLASVQGWKIGVWDITDETIVTFCTEIGEDLARDSHAYLWYYSVAFSDDGMLLAAASNSELTIWDVSSGICLKVLHDHSTGFTSVAFSRDGKMLVSGSEYGTISIWGISHSTWLDNHNVEDPGPVSRLPDRVACAALSDDGGRVALALKNGEIRIWDADRSIYLKSPEVHKFTAGIPGYTESIAFSHDSIYIASSNSKVVNVLDVGSHGHGCFKQYRPRDYGSVNLNLKKPKLYPKAAFSYDLTYIISVQLHSQVTIWEVESHTEIARFDINDFDATKQLVASVACSNDATCVVVGFERDYIGIWNLSGTSPYAKMIRFHGGKRMTSVAISYNATQAASASTFGTIKVWHTTCGACLRALEIGRPDIYNLAFDATGSYLLTDIGAIFWNTSPDSNTEPATTALEKSRYCGYGIRADGTWITWNGQDVIWLPEEYRPFLSSVRSNTVVTVSLSDHLQVFKFSSSKSPLE